MITIKIESLKDISEAAILFLDMNKGSKKFAIFGRMGVGKTTFIKYLCKTIGVQGKIVNSPTFTIINEYSTGKNELVYHFDFYRIKKKEELDEIGIDEYLYSDSYCFIEWPEIIEGFLPEGFVKVYLSENNDKSRTIEIRDLLYC